MIFEKLQKQVSSHERCVAELCRDVVPALKLMNRNSQFLPASRAIKRLAKDKTLMSEENGTALRQSCRKILSRLALGRKEDQLKLLSLLQGADPGLFFPFLAEKRTLVRRDAFEHVFTSVSSSLNELCPHRQREGAALVKLILRRLLGDQHAPYPVLVGGAGDGKSELARQAGEALSQAGIRTSVIFQSMTEKNGLAIGNQTEMHLLGSDSHYDNGAPGAIFEAAVSSTVDLVLVVLDEADKHHNCYELMIRLLDPKQPLIDIWLAGLSEQFDMRHKVMFILTANDTAPLCLGDNDPLWSRLQAINFTPYTRTQLIDLLTILAQRDYAEVYGLDSREYQAMASMVVDPAGTPALGFRTYMNMMGELACGRISSVATDLTFFQKESARRRIGF